MQTDLTPAELNRIGEWAGLFNGGRAAVRCGQCDGRGWGYTKLTGEVRVECSNCDHGIRVLDEGQLQSAWVAWYCVHPRLEDQWASAFGTPISLDFRAWWNKRQGQPWQAALEAAVLDYREDWEPTGDDVLAVQDKVLISPDCVLRFDGPKATYSCGGEYGSSSGFVTLRAALAIVESEVE